MSDHPLDMPGRLMIARSVVGAMDDRGYCVCPGREQHSNKSGPVREDRPGRDCRVYLSKSSSNSRGVPTIKCVHSSCSGAVAEANHKLRSEIAKMESKLAKDAGYVFKPERGKRRTKEQIAVEAHNWRLQGMALRSKQGMARILSKFPWTRPDMWEASAEIPESETEQANCILRLFETEDVVWIGGFVDSIAPEDAEEKRERLAEVRTHFRLRDEWLADTRRAGLRICPNGFKSGSHSRGIEAILYRRFLVIEHDSLPMDDQGAMLRWMGETAMRLRAIVFTGSKSYHGWFDCPNESDLEKVKATLCGLLGNLGEGKRGYIGGMGYDPATFNPSQPYPLPGCPHRKTDKPAELIYLKP